MADQKPQQTSINLRLDHDLRDKIENEAAKLRVSSVSEMTRMILKDYFRPRGVRK